MSFDRLRRRDFVTLLGSAAVTWPLAARAQPVPVIGVLLIGTAADDLTSAALAALREGLRDAGYVEGRNLAIEYRFAENHYERLPALASDLVRRQVAVIFASGGGQAPPAAKAATTTIPIVFAGGFDPIQSGLVTSLNRPGGNITGMAGVTAELAGKSVEIIRELLPSAHRVVALANAPDPFSKPFLEHIRLGGVATGTTIDAKMIRSAEELEAAFSEMEKERPDAIIVQPSLPSTRSAELALRYRIPAVSAVRGFVDEGGLMSYAAAEADMYGHAALYVDKILKGAKPAELPVEQPTKFVLIINMKTAKSLGLTVAPAFLARADEVIE
jgi:putative ABC transport system substrate-binding protein